MPSPRSLYFLAFCDAKRPDDRRTGFSGVDDVVDHPVPGGDVNID
jgi:hypothetical protein